MSGLDSLLVRQPPTTWDRFLASPLIFAAQQLYRRCELPVKLNPAHDSIRVVCISDTHNSQNSQPSLPNGDILIHAGDLSHSGTVDEVSDALKWLSAEPHTYKLFVAGNHDSALANTAERDALLNEHRNLIYLQDSSAVLTVRGRVLRVYGSPYTLKHGAWVFQYPRALALRAEEAGVHSIWSAIPLTTDILVTHGPPLAHLDLGSGCTALLSALWRVRPQLHVFGHIRGGRGVERLGWGRVQRAYEDVLAGQRAWWSLIKLAWLAIVGNAAIALRIHGSTGEGGGTLLVNAAAVCGVRDQERRGAIVVEI